MILTKSASRFARNTVDCLKVIRVPKSRGIGVIFEKKDLWTEGVVKTLQKNQISKIYQRQISSKNNVVSMINVLFTVRKFFYRFVLYSRFIALRYSIKAFGV